MGAVIANEPIESYTQSKLSLDYYNQPKLSIEPESNQTTLPAPLAEDRAGRAEYGLSSVGVTKDKAYEQIAQGREDQFRQQVSSDLDLLNSDARRDLLTRAQTKQLDTASARNIVRAAMDLGTPTDPRTVIEESYAKKYMNILDEMADRYNNDTVWGVVRNVMPTNAQAAKDAGTGIVAKQQLAVKLLQDYTAKEEGQSYIGYGLDWLKGVVPFYTQVKLSGVLSSIPGLKGFLQGENLQAQKENLFQKPWDEFKELLPQAAEKLYRDNPQAAVAFLTAIVGHSTAERGLANVNTAFDISQIPGVFGLGRSILRGLTEKAELSKVAKQAVQDVAKGSASAEPANVTAPAAAGDLREAAIQRMTNQFVAQFKNSADPIKDAMEALPAFLKQTAAELADPLMQGNLGAEISNKMSEGVGKFQIDLMNAISNALKVERTPINLAAGNVMRALWDRTKQMYVGLDNSIISILPPVKEPFSNSYWVQVNIGKPGGEMFFRRNEAEAYAKAHGVYLEGSSKVQKDNIIQSGSGYYIKHGKYMAEDEDVIRDMMLQTKNNVQPFSWVNAFIGRLRNPDDVLAASERENRKIATYVKAYMMESLKNEAKDIEGLTKWTIPFTKKANRWKDLKRVLENAKNVVDPDTGDPGYYFKNVAELEYHYNLWLKRLPDAQEARAYFTYKNLMDADHTLRNIAVYRNKVRLGVESQNIFYTDNAGNKVSSGDFDGVLRKGWPGGGGVTPEGTSGGLIVVNTGKKREMAYAGSLEAKKLQEKYGEQVAEGKMRVIEVWDTESRPLKNWGKEIGNRKVRYIVTDQLEQPKRIQWQQIPRKGGGHFEYDYDHYIKQAKVITEHLGNYTRHMYEGDTTVMPVALRRMGQDLVEKMNIAREFMKKGDDAAAKGIIDNLHIPWDEWNSWFKGKKVLGLDGKWTTEEPRLNLNEPFHVVPKGQLIGDLGQDVHGFVERYGNNYINGTKSGNMARHNVVQFTGERDAYELKTIVNKGTRFNPLYDYVPAKQIDPIPSLNRALTRIVNSTFLDDYKIFAVERWLRDAEGYLKDPSMARYSPFFVFNNPEEMFVKGIRPEVKNLLMSSRFQIEKLMGTPSKTDVMLHSLAQKLADDAYEKTGRMPIDPAWLLPKLKDPFRFIRSITFDAKLGLFAIPQLLVQAQTFATIWGVAGPKAAAPGTLAAVMAGWAKVNGNPNIVRALDRMMSKFGGFKPGEFEEAYKEFRRTGFGSVAGEYALRDDYMAGEVIKSGTQRFLQTGRMFFTGGERSTRYGAYFTAYREFRDKFPTKVLSDADRRMILNRADDLYVNMSRASSSLLHQGAWSIPTQFLSYQMRAAELFLGKRVASGADGLGFDYFAKQGMNARWDRMAVRARMMATYAALYGFPTALGVTGFPAGDFLRKYAIENNYVVGDNFFQDLAMNGVPALLLSFVLGKQYNVGDRFGTQGFETMREMLRGDKKWYEILGGAAWSTFMTNEQYEPFAAFIWSFFRDDGKYVPVTLDDWLEPLKAVSSYSQFAKVKSALVTGRWMSNKGMYLDDTSPVQAIFQGLTGLQDQNISDLNLIAWSKKDRDEYNKYTEQLYIKEFRKGLLALRDNNQEQADKYFKNALIYFKLRDFPQDMQAGAMSLATKDNEALIDRLNWDFKMKHVPLGMERDAAKALLRFKELREQEKMKR